MSVTLNLRIIYFHMLIIKCVTLNPLEVYGCNTKSLSGSALYENAILNMDMYYHTSKSLFILMDFYPFNI